MEKSKWNVLLLVFNVKTSNRNFIIRKIFTRINLQIFDLCHEKFNEVDIFF